MTGALLRIELKDQESALAPLAALIAATSDPTNLFENIGLYLVTSTQHRFDTGIGVDGNPWPPSLRVKVHGGKTLQLSGRLYRSFSFQASRSGLEFGTNVIYAAIHQFGGDIQQPARTQTLHFKTVRNTSQLRFAKAKKANLSKEAHIGARTIKMPARPFIGLDDADDTAITNIAEKWLAGQGDQLQ